MVNETCVVLVEKQTLITSVINATEGQERCVKTTDYLCKEIEGGELSSLFSPSEIPALPPSVSCPAVGP